MPYTLIRVGPEDQTAFADHVSRQALESGVNDQPIFMPFAVPPDFRDEAVLARQKAGWAKNIGEPGWIADWGGLSDGVFVAHISLKGGSIEADQHRALVQLGVERAHQSQHLATRMLQEVIEFSKAAGLAWLDLRVFAHNHRAIGLYQRFGFAETGRVTDCFRVGDRSITDISMSLKLSARDLPG